MTRAQAYHTGLGAEKIGAWLLRLKGYRVLAMRYRAFGGEIDILAQKGRTLVAVEVKARRALAECREAVTADKQRRIAQALEGALAGHGKIAGLAAARVDNIRFDVIWCAPGKWPVHLKDAWRMG
jgi:putative endonuclease